MTRRYCIAAALAVTALALPALGCGGDDEEEAAEETPAETTEAAGGGEDPLTLELREQNGSRQSGTATLTPLGARTRIVMELSNAGALPRPAHVHPGSCDDLGPPVAGLESLVDGRSETVVPLYLAELQARGLVVHAHKSDAEFEVSVACAPIPEG